jgi:hypothetical protein
LTEQPVPPSGWVVGDGRPASRRRWIVGCLVVVLAAVVLIAVGIFALSRSSFGQGLGAAAAIYDHGKPQIFRANYYEYSGQPPTMQVFLAAGVDPSVARGVGCGVVRSELAKAGLANLHWVVYAASGQALADSGNTNCP